MCAHRRARHAEAARLLGLIERRAGRNEAAHDLVGELQAQFLRQGPAAPTGFCVSDGDGPRPIDKGHDCVPDIDALGSSIKLT